MEGAEGVWVGKEKERWAGLGPAGREERKEATEEKPRKGGGFSFPFNKPFENNFNSVLNIEKRE
jgi:hypothetical protein